MIGTTPAGMSGRDYLRWCELLGRPAVDVPSMRPTERQEALPAWCSPALIATEASRERLSAWARAGSATPTDDELVRRLAYLGDEDIRDVVLVALHERIAPPAAAYLLEHVLFMGIGYNASGYAIRCAMPPGPVLRVVLLSASAQFCGAHTGERLMAVCLHEAAHAWLGADPAPETAIDTREMSNRCDAALLSAFSNPDVMRGLLARERRSEDQADALARAWGAAIEGTAHADNAQTIARAAQLAATFGGHS